MSISISIYQYIDFNIALCNGRQWRLTLVMLSSPRSWKKMVLKSRNDSLGANATLSKLLGNTFDWMARRPLLVVVCGGLEICMVGRTVYGVAVYKVAFNIFVTTIHINMAYDVASAVIAWFFANWYFWKTSYLWPVDQGDFPLKCARLQNGWV